MMHRFLSHLMKPLSRLLEVPLKRVLKFALKSTLGRFLRHDLKFEQFCLSLNQGNAKLIDVDLDADEIHRVLGFLFPRIRRIFIQSIVVEAFGQDGCLHVSVTGFEIELEATEEYVPFDSDEVTETSDYRFREEDDLSGFEDEDLSQAARTGLQSLGDWIEAYTAGLQLDVEDITVRVFRGSTYTGEKSLNVRVPYVRFRDLSGGG